MNNSFKDTDNIENLNSIFIKLFKQKSIIPNITSNQLSNELMKTSASIILKIGGFIAFAITISVTHSTVIAESQPLYLLFVHFIKTFLTLGIPFLLLIKKQYKTSVMSLMILNMIDLIIQIVITKNSAVFGVIVPVIAMPAITFPRRSILNLMLIFTAIYIVLIINLPYLRNNDWLSTIIFTWAILICFLAIGQGLQGVISEYARTREAHELEAIQRARIEEQNRLLVEHNDRLLFAQHDLRGPCNSVLGAVEILQTADLDQPTQQHLLQQLEPATLQLRARIDALFDQAKTPLLANQQELPQIDLAQVVAEHLPELRRMTNLLAPSADQPARVWAAGERSVMIRGRLGELQRILENLVINAASVGATQIQIETSQRGGQAALTISDNGPGFPAWLLAQPLRPMVSGRQHGTGLGLAGTVANVQAFAGTLELRNTGSGGVVDIRFPAFAEECLPGGSDATKLQPAT